MTTNGGSSKERDYLRVGEVAVLFHVSPKTVVRWAEDGKLPHIVTLGGHRRFPRESIESLVPTLSHHKAEATGTAR